VQPAKQLSTATVFGILIFFSLATHRVVVVVNSLGELV
jgi:uncharacterized membrane protein